MLGAAEVLAPDAVFVRRFVDQVLLLREVSCDADDGKWRGSKIERDKERQGLQQNEAAH